jgi:hypothetical protein
VPQEPVSAPPASLYLHCCTGITVHAKPTPRGSYVPFAPCPPDLESAAESGPAGKNDGPRFSVGNIVG